MGQPVMRREPLGERALARGGGTVDGDDHAALSPDRGAQPAHQRDEGREARRDHGAVIDGHRLLRGKAHDEEGHGDAVVEMGRDRAAAPHAPAARRGR